jgi:anti-anti-sigma factor
MFSQRNIDKESVLIDVGKLLDNNNAHEMSEAISGAQAAGKKYIILDISDLGFISSAGVGSILGAVGKSREMGGDIILCGVSEKILHILEVLDLCDYLTITSDEHTAVELCGVEGK